jgi:hypothetical protein
MTKLRENLLPSLRMKSIRFFKALGKDHAREARCIIKTLSEQHNSK